ncbi:MAG TPA: zinc dependent phospholipase C family protein [Thermodesulfovibrionales bacterium]|nr:zinc dependent phospholipase C family protein [Thermodesulfovibrionales bacterium]
MAFNILLILYIILSPTIALAWGPLTHVYLGNELLSLGALIPAGIFQIIRRYKKDFLYGTLMADLVVGKKYLPEHKNSHNWAFAFELLKSAETKQQKAFVYGYMSHLAADTVAHNVYTAEKKNIAHTLLELKADCIIDKKYWSQAIAIDKKTQMRNDLFLENSVNRFLFSFKTNKRILKGMVYLSVLNREKIADFIDKNIVTSMPLRETIEHLHQESIDKIIDLFRHLDKSEVVHVNPIGTKHRRRMISNEFKAFLFRPIKLDAAKYKRFGISRFRDI